MKKIVALFLAICAVAGLSACGQESTPPLPNELATPQYSIKLAPETDFAAIPKAEIHSAGDIKVVGEAKTETPLPAAISLTPDTIWQEDATVTYNAFTLPEKAAFSDGGNIGVLSIPTLKLTVNVYEADDKMEAMEKGAAHFKSTSAWDGNVGISAHNVNFNGTDGYFKNLYTLKIGDNITYETALGTRNYSVTAVKNIPAYDWNSLSRNTENRLTLITCISGQPEKRLMVQAVEKQ